MATRTLSQPVTVTHSTHVAVTWTVEAVAGLAMRLVALVVLVGVVERCRGSGDGLQKCILCLDRAVIGMCSPLVISGGCWGKQLVSLVGCSDIFEQEENTKTY